jgi:hypothetical protein
MLEAVDRLELYTEDPLKIDFQTFTLEEHKS